jgi:hypothetical protein
MPEKKRLGMMENEITRFHRSIKIKCQGFSSFDADNGFVDSAEIRPVCGFSHGRYPRANKKACPGAAPAFEPGFLS